MAVCTQCKPKQDKWVVAVKDRKPRHTHFKLLCIFVILTFFTEACPALRKTNYSPLHLCLSDRCQNQSNACTVTHQLKKEEARFLFTLQLPQHKAQHNRNAYVSECFRCVCVSLHCPYSSQHSGSVMS